MLRRILLSGSVRWHHQNLPRTSASAGVNEYQCLEHPPNGTFRFSTHGWVPMFYTCVFIDTPAQLLSPSAPCIGIYHAGRAAGVDEGPRFEPRNPTARAAPTHGAGSRRLPRSRSCAPSAGGARASLPEGRRRRKRTGPARTPSPVSALPPPWAQRRPTGTPSAVWALASAGWRRLERTRTAMTNA